MREGAHERRVRSRPLSSLRIQNEAPAPSGAWTRVPQRYRSGPSGKFGMGAGSRAIRPRVTSPLGPGSINWNRAGETQQRDEYCQPGGAIHRGTTPVAEPGVSAPLAEPRTSQTASVTITSTKRSALKPCGYRLPPAALVLVSSAPSTPPFPASSPSGSCSRRQSDRTRYSVAMRSNS